MRRKRLINVKQRQLGFASRVFDELQEYPKYHTTKLTLDDEKRNCRY